MAGFIHAIRHALTRLGVLTAHPFAFGIVGGYALLWLWFRPSTFDWHAVAVLSTWFMTLLIQRAEHRDTQAIHAKLDELLSATTMLVPSSAGWTKSRKRSSEGEGRKNPRS